MSLVGEEGYEYHLLIHRDSEGKEMPGRRDEMQSIGSKKLPSGFGDFLQLEDSKRVGGLLGRSRMWRQESRMDGNAPGASEPVVEPMSPHSSSLPRPCLPPDTARTKASLLPAAFLPTSSEVGRKAETELEGA